MSIHAWHLLGVAVPYVLIATALWGLAAGAIKDAVAVGSLAPRTPLRVGRWRREVPTVPLAYALGFLAVAFIYGCALDRNHMTAALGVDPHAAAPGADAFLYGLAAASWLSAALLLAPYRRLRRGTRALLVAPAERDRALTRYRLLAEHITDLVTHHEPDGRYEWLSGSAQAILGYRPEELVGRMPSELIHPDDVDRVRAELQDLLGGGTLADTISRYRIRHRDGRYVWMESLTEPIRGESGEILRLQVASRDVTERQAVEDELHRRAHHDPLTGLANRVLFGLRLDALLAQGAPFAVLYADLDRFKAVNDTLGHEAGDELLVQFAARLGAVARDGGTAARIGGDEFALLLEGVGTAEAAAEAAARIERAAHAPFRLGAAERAVTVSIGIALGRPEHAAASDVLREADLAAYAAKAEGRARWAVFTDGLREASARRLRIEADLEGAAARGELRVVYQPIVRLGDGRLSGAEALVRWDHPELGPLPPDVFIPIAEETGHIAALDRWVMAEGLAQLERWDAEAGCPLDLTLSVNCSARGLQDRGFVRGVRALLAGAPDRARRLVVEITESLLVEDPRRAAGVLEALHADGVRFAMDDFGTGYSSLSVVHALPVDALKVDRAFVRRMDEDPAAHAMVKTVVGFARALGTHVVAEGIETPAQLDALVSLGCDLGQGYLFARPLPPDELGAMIRRDGADWAHHWGPTGLAA